MFSYKVIKGKLIKFLKFTYAATALNSLIRNSYAGMPNSQLELAKFYLFEIENFIEAYAWADVACCRNLNGAESIRSQAKEKLKPEQTKEAWDMARLYKQKCTPKGKI